MKYEISNGSKVLSTVDGVKTYSVSGLTPLTSYTLSVIANNGLRKSSAATVTFKTRGVQFIIPKQLTVGSTINLRYEEYPLGIVPIGTEPSGMFGGGNKQNLSAKVISTANSRSVVEVDSNVIDVGGRNLLTGRSRDLQTAPDSGSSISGGVIHQLSSDDLSILASNLVTLRAFIHNTTTHTVNLVIWTNGGDFGVGTGVPAGADGYSTITAYNATSSSTRGDINVRAYTENAAISGVQYKEFKLEKGSVATPYASFVDGDTFTAQPDGTYALFSEYKALYYG
jgi:hypothetical protein